MVLKTTPIYLDRLDSALKKAGVSIKRSQLLETAAAAFGYHNSNEFTAAVSRGDFNPPAADAIGSLTLPNGQAIVVLTDKTSGRPYAIDKSFLEQNVSNERGEKIGVTPFGNLADVHGISLDAIATLNSAAEANMSSPQFAGDNDHVVIRRDTLASLVGAADSYSDDLSSGLADGTYDDEADLQSVEAAIISARASLASKSSPTIPSPAGSGSWAELKVPIFGATIDHKHGTNAYAAFSEDELYAELAEFCGEYWNEIVQSADVPSSTDGLSHREIVDTYFEANEDEFLHLGTNYVTLPPYQTLIANARKVGASEPSEPPYPTEADDSTKGRDRCRVCDCILLPYEENFCRSHLKAAARDITLPDANYINDVASALTDGVNSDIWFDAHDYEGEENAENTITETQNAMDEAARILRLLTDNPTIRPEQLRPANVEDSVGERDSVIWLTDDDGEPIFNVAANEPFFKRIGLDYGRDGEDFLPLTDQQAALVKALPYLQSKYAGGGALSSGRTVIFNRQKFHALTMDCTSFGPTQSSADIHAAFDRIEADLKPAMRNLGGHIIRTTDDDGNDEKFHILLPFAIAFGANSFEDYAAAVDYLVHAAYDSAAKHVSARFVPQAWIRDNAVEIDGEGATEFDVTFELLLLGFEKAMDIAGNADARDQLIQAHCAPAWIQTWSGPFDMKVDQDDVDDLFKICR
jgi:hypothetical protein